LPERLQPLRGPAALAAIPAATTADGYVHATHAANCNRYRDGHRHAGSWQPYPNSDWCAQRDTYAHRHAAGTANGHADAAAATTHGHADATATTTHGHTDAATATPHGYADTAAATPDSYADAAATTDQHTCSVSYSNPARRLTQSATSILEFRIEKPPEGSARPGSRQQAGETFGRFD
jgi:hypothetical protein